MPRDVTRPSYIRTPKGFAGVLKAGSLEVWQCEHGHYSASNARRCADEELARRADVARAEAKR
jgi:hypothetical protein